MICSMRYLEKPYLVHHASVRIPPGAQSTSVQDTIYLLDIYLLDCTLLRMEARPQRSLWRRGLESARSPMLGQRRSAREENHHPKVLGQPGHVVIPVLLHFVAPYLTPRSIQSASHMRRLSWRVLASSGVSLLPPVDELCITTSKRFCDWKNAWTAEVSRRSSSAEVIALISYRAGLAER